MFMFDHSSTSLSQNISKEKRVVLQLYTFSEFYYANDKYEMIPRTVPKNKWI